MYLSAIVATVKSRCADSGKAPEFFGTMTWLNVSEGTIFASLRCCFRVIPNTVLVSSVAGTYSGSIWSTRYFPPFFFLRISSASAE